METLAHCAKLDDKLAAAFESLPPRENALNTDRAFVSATLMAEENRSAIESHLSEVLKQSLTPMEPGQAKTYMEHTAVRMAEEAGAGVTSASITNFSKDDTSPPSNQPQEWSIKFTPPIKAAFKVLAVS